MIFFNMCVCVCIYLCDGYCTGEQADCLGAYGALKPPRLTGQKSFAMPSSPAQHPASPPS